MVVVDVLLYGSEMVEVDSGRNDAGLEISLQISVGGFNTSLAKKHTMKSCGRYM